MTDLGITGLEDIVEIGRGGFGVVYRARQRHLDRFVAVKLLLSQIVDETNRARFQREGRALGSLSSHPNIVTLYEFGVTDADTPYLVMEYLPDGSLANRLTRHGRLGVDDATHAAVQVAGALETSHRLGILHRDVKPENVLVGLLGEPKLGDYGIAHLDADASNTSTVRGSPAHTAPEVLDGQAAGVRSDVYSLGSTLYSLLSARAAFVKESDESLFAMLGRIATMEPPDLRGFGVPDAVWNVVIRAMAKRPEDRQASAEELGSELNEARRALGLPAIRIPVAARGEDPAGLPRATHDPRAETMATIDLRMVPATAASPVPPSPADPASAETVAQSPTIKAPDPAPATDTSAPTGVPGPARPAHPSAGRGRGVIVAAMVIVAVLLAIGTVVWFVRRSSSEVANPPPTSVSSTTSSAVRDETVTTLSSGDASVTLTEPAPVGVGQALAVPIAFAGDPSQVELTGLVVNGVPADSVPGLRNQFIIPTSSAGVLQLKAVIRLKDGRTIESNTTQAHVVTSTSVPPPTNVAPPSSGATTTTVQTGGIPLALRNQNGMAIRRTPTTTGAIVRTVGPGDQLSGVCSVVGDAAPAVGEAPATDRWVRLVDSTFIWEGWVTSPVPAC